MEKCFLCKKDLVGRQKVLCRECNSKVVEKGKKWGGKFVLGAIAVGGTIWLGSSSRNGVEDGDI